MIDKIPLWVYYQNIPQLQGGIFMLLKTQEEIINMVREEHLIQNDFFLRWIEFFPKEGERILSLTFSLLHQNEVMLSRQYSEQ